MNPLISADFAAILAVGFAVGLTNYLVKIGFFCKHMKQENEKNLASSVDSSDSLDSVDSSSKESDAK